jgi:hypothetical protein
MSLYVLRLRDGNCIMVDAASEDEARSRVKPVPGNEIATARNLESFVARFSLTDDGELTSTLVDKRTVAELHEHEYPLLNAAHAHSYTEFDASETDSKTDAVLFDHNASVHARGWDKRDKQIVSYAVEQERQRFAN